MWWYLHKLTRLVSLVRPPWLQYWMWCRSTRRDSHPGNRHRHLSRSRAARRSAGPGLRRRRPTSSTAPSWSCRIQDKVAVQASIWAVLTLTAGPSSTWRRGSAWSSGAAGVAGGVSAETPAARRGGGGGGGDGGGGWAVDIGRSGILISSALDPPVQPGPEDISLWKAQPSCRPRPGPQA